MHGHSSRRRLMDASAFYPFLSPHCLFIELLFFIKLFSLKIGTFTKVITNSDNSMNISNLTAHWTQTNGCS